MILSNKHQSGIAIMLFLLISLTGKAQTSDSLIVSQMKSVGINFSPCNEVQLIMSGKDKFALLFDDIRKAKSSVHLEYFNFRNDSIASLLFDILREKRKEGVEVRALFDGFGNDSNNQPLKKHHIRSLRNDSIDIHEFDPVRFPWVNHIWPRDHRKIVVIDGHIAYTGGMNVADYYIVGTKQVGEWRDMHCRIEGPVVNELQEIFARIWQKVTKEKLQDAKYYQGTEKGNKMVGIANREPNKTNKIMRQFYISALDDAQDSIKIINPYFTLTPSVKKAIHRAIKRGVKVDILVSAKSDIPLTPDAVFYNVHKLMKKGANIWLYQPGFHHSKIMMVDGRFCTVGSTNLDARSLRYDYEVNALIINKQVTQELQDMFMRDTKKSILLTPEEWDKFRTGWQKFRGWFAQLFTPFM
ncbi:phosphatidylserine/phosphatidylglycerophosphate/cardiolipin synthase family protein [Prevotella sp. MA2016]|uniref:phospholipase D-like domain-containing protein n=1 Tax=Prevotella sp. MA2016 TaxID=1408310 RepID=UPI00048E8069|nr:phospholipase D-like domain-containing protein [Prevotella sp. MA2016]